MQVGGSDSAFGPDFQGNYFIMDDKNVVDFTAYRRGETGQVPCPRCSRPVPADSTRCPHCRVHYQGAAYEFAEANTPDANQVTGWIRLIVWIVLAIVVTMGSAILVGSLIR